MELKCRRFVRQHENMLEAESPAEGHFAIDIHMLDILVTGLGADGTCLRAQLGSPDPLAAAKNGGSNVAGSVGHC